MAYKAASWDSWDRMGGRCDRALALRVDGFLFGVLGDWVGESVVLIVGDSEEEVERRCKTTQILGGC